MDSKIKNKIEQVKTEVDTLQKTMESKCRAAFTELTDMVFDIHPVMKSFTFRAYTPYFNDGDTCEYRVDTDYIDINDTEGYDLEPLMYQERKEPGTVSEKDKELLGAQEDVRQILRAFPDDFFKTLVGDHVEVIVNKGGITTTEYSHD